MSQQIPVADFVDNLMVLWEETLGIPAKPEETTWYLDRNAGWAASLAGVSAAAASRPIVAGGTSIAAQTAHAAYYLERFEAIVADRREPSDWPASFRPAEVDEEAWTRSKERLFAAAERVGRLLRGNPHWEREHLGGAMANLVHLAYHLGAVRQMLRVAKG